MQCPCRSFANSALSQDFPQWRLLAFQPAHGIPFLKGDSQMKRMLLTLAALVWCLAPANGAEVEGQTAEVGAIRKAVELYVACFNQGDAKASAARGRPKQSIQTHSAANKSLVARRSKSSLRGSLKIRNWPSWKPPQLPSISSRQGWPSNRGPPGSCYRIKNQKKANIPQSMSNGMVNGCSIV